MLVNKINTVYFNLHNIYINKYCRFQSTYFIYNSKFNKLLHQHNSWLYCILDDVSGDRETAWKEEIRQKLEVELSKQVREALHTTTYHSPKKPSIRTALKCQPHLVVSKSGRRFRNSGETVIDDQVEGLGSVFSSHAALSDLSHVSCPNCI